MCRVEIETSGQTAGVAPLCGVPPGQRLLRTAEHKPGKDRSVTALRPDLRWRHP